MRERTLNLKQTTWSHYKILCYFDWVHIIRSLYLNFFDTSSEITTGLADDVLPGEFEIAKDFE